MMTTFVGKCKTCVTVVSTDSAGMAFPHRANGASCDGAYRVTACV